MPPAHLPRLSYISARHVTKEARKQGLSVDQYVAQLWDESGLVESNMSRFDQAGVFSKRGGCIVEIGPGTGRYLKQILDRSSPAEYQIYEIADDWCRWLTDTYAAIKPCRTDGVSLAETGTSSADLIFSFGVFVYLPFMTSIRYFREMHRVAAPGSFVVFDIISEQGLTERLLQQWIESGLYYPAFLSSRYVVGLFESAGFSLIDSFTSKFGPAQSEFLIFKRKR